MYSIKNNILYFIVFIVLGQVQSLVQLRVADNDIVVTEAAIRETVNGIFSSLKLEDVKRNPRFGEFATIHNFFATVTLQDHDNVKEIERLVRVDNTDNNTQFFITQVNEVLNEDNKSYEGADDENVIALVNKFIRKLKFLKFKYGFANNDANFDINTEVVNHLHSDEILDNSTETTQEISDTDGNLLDHEFWRPNVNRRIFEGKRQSIKKYPFMASVQFFKKFQCGGSIIKSDLVITSASCLQLAWNNRFFRENPAFLSVQVGCDLYEAGDENIPVLEVYFHPEYSPKNLKNNIAIMRLVRFLKFGKRYKRVKKIDFDRNPSPLSVNTQDITIIGWGAKTSTNIITNIWRNRLSSARLDFYPLRDCQDIYSKEFVGFRNFCAGFVSKGGGACNRDAGGPGISRGKLVGVISFGAPTCGAHDAPTVFTKVGYYTDWIESIIEMETPTVARSTTQKTTRPSYKMPMSLPIGISTAKFYNIKPVTQEGVAEVTEAPVIDALRSADLYEDKLFKDFIATMFGEGDVKEYVDQLVSHSDNTTKTTTKVASISTTSKLTKPTTEKKSQVLRENNKESLKLVSTMKELVDLKKISTEQSIARLINNMDVQDLFSTFDLDETSFEESKEKVSEQDQRQIRKNVVKISLESTEENNTSSNNSSSSSYESDESSDGDYQSDSDIEQLHLKPADTKNIAVETVNPFKNNAKEEDSSNDILSMSILDGHIDKHFDKNR